MVNILKISRLFFWSSIGNIWNFGLKSKVGWVLADFSSDLTAKLLEQ